MGVYIRMQYVYVHNATTISCNRRLCTVWQQREKERASALHNWVIDYVDTSLAISISLYSTPKILITLYIYYLIYIYINIFMGLYRHIYVS